MIIKTFVLGMYQTNCYMIIDEDSKECAIIDPGYYSRELDDEIDKGYTVKYIIFTHGHFDHILGLYHYYTKYNPQILIHSDDSACLTDDRANFTYPAPCDFKPVKPTTLLKDCDQISVGNLNFSIIHTPGHTLGGICVYGSGVLFSGDTLFYRSVGRTDFYGGSFEVLSDSIKKLYTLPDDVVVYPGHGQKTTIGEEKHNNPFVRLL